MRWAAGIRLPKRKFRRERTREKFRRLKFQPVLPSSHNRDLRKLLRRGRWREVRSKENRESSTAKRDFHPFYLLFFPLPFLSFSLLFPFFFLLPPPFARRDRIALSNTPPVSPPPSLFHHREKRRRRREKRKRGGKL